MVKHLLALKAYLPVCITNLQIPTVVCCIHPLFLNSHVKNPIPFSQFLRLRRLCSADSDFSDKAEETCHLFKKGGYPDSVVKTAQQIDRLSALQTSQTEKNERIPITLMITYHPHNHFKEL